MRGTALALLALLALAAAPAPARAQSAATATLTADVREALGRLSSADPLTAADADLSLFDAGPRAVDALIEVLGRGAQPAAMRAASLLGRIRDPRAIVPLKRALRDTANERERLAYAIAICRLGDREGVPPLVELLASGDRELRLEAEVALRRFTHQDFGFRFDASASERAAAVERWRAWWRRSASTFTVVRAPD